MRRPVVEPEGEQIELGEIHMRIADKTGFIPEIPGETHGVNANGLAKNTHRDRSAGTPFHRYIPCRVEKI
jgi:hypothetical protein